MAFLFKIDGNEPGLTAEDVVLDICLRQPLSPLLEVVRAFRILTAKGPEKLRVKNVQRAVRVSSCIASLCVNNECAHTRRI
jgi:hypothetical protein